MYNRKDLRGDNIRQGISKDDEQHGEKTHLHKIIILSIFLLWDYHDSKISETKQRRMRRILILIKKIRDTSDRI